MGMTLSRIWNWTFNRRKHWKILMVGLNGVGKATILNRLRLGNVYATTTGVGLNVTRVDYHNLTINVFDVGEEKSLRVFWGHFTQGVDAVIYVVDAADSDGMQVAREELEAVLETVDDPTTPVVVMANKQDLPRALPASEVTQALRMTQHGRPWRVVATCATNLQGVDDAFDWLSQVVK
ncbi:ADP-ribosylation factor-like [Penaeus monodon]|uniref:ADP-ribosylation factor-like n=1 Tax=Penaeus monodon TaxID=6687 RepID=UPI0018A7A823|nr:ADP-ribosylation factor-like [Penaeus monodon]